MVSVIIPVYNAEKYLAQAIESVVSQTYTDWELILVDDGATDLSANICESAAINDSRINVFHKTNGGLSSARNLGLDNANGDHIIFLDADDLLPSAAIETFLQYSKECDITCAFLKHFEDSEIPEENKSVNPRKNYTLTPVETLKKILYQNKIDNSVCGKFYSADVWKNLRFREGTGYEDLDIISPLILKANKIAVIETPLYFYRQHQASYIHTFSLKRADVLEVTQKLSDYIADVCPLLLPAAHSRQLSANFNILGLIAANRNMIGNMDDKAYEIADGCWRKIKELRGESLRNPYVRLKNKLGILASYMGGKDLMESLSSIIYR